MSDSKENEIVNVAQPYIVRIAGYNFSIFKQGFHQPYDPTFQYSMMLTMNDLILAFQASTGYTHLFDIILVFDKNRSQITMSPMRLLTMYTSYATVRFNHHMVEQIHNPFFVHSYAMAKISSIMARQTLFYATFVQPHPLVPGTPLLQWLINRCCHHALNQTVLLWAQTLLGPDRCESQSNTKIESTMKPKSTMKSRDELLDLLQVEKSIRWATDVPTFMSYGIFGKLDINPKTTAQVGICNRAIILEDTNNNSEWMHQWILAPHWPITLIPQYLGDKVETKDVFNVMTFKENIQSQKIQ